MEEKQNLDIQESMPEKKENAFKGCTAMSYFGTKIETLTANMVDLKKVKELGAKALDFGNEYKTFAVVGATAGMDLDVIFGDTQKNV